MNLLFFIIAFCASVIGGICGIGGGILMKPLMDLFGLADVAAASFLSVCTVFVMSLYNVSRSFHERSGDIELKTTLPLAIGAAVGGILGNQAFHTICCMVSREIAGIAQSLCLMLLTLGTLLYTLKKSRIHTRYITAPIGCGAVGLGLGMASSFLGIGGGPFNLAVLHYFFGMDTKIAVANSLFVILLSQTTNLGSSLLSGSIPAVSPFIVLLMVIGGIGGGAVGRKYNKKLTAATIDKLFIGLLLVIVCICLWNTSKYVAAL